MPTWPYLCDCGRERRLIMPIGVVRYKGAFCAAPRRGSAGILNTAMSGSLLCKYGLEASENRSAQVQK